MVSFYFYPSFGLMSHVRTDERRKVQIYPYFAKLVGIFEISRYPFEKFWYTGFVVSSQNLQQQQMSLESADCRSSQRLSGRI